MAGTLAPAAAGQRPLSAARAADLQRERDADGPADTTGTPDWFRTRYAGRLTERKG